jgi:Uma2 family endonuclease
MSHRPERHYNVEDYFAIEESSAIKHEFFGGEIFAMAGASLRHNRINGNVYAALRARLHGTSCEAFSNDLRVRTLIGRSDSTRACVKASRCHRSALTCHSRRFTRGLIFNDDTA